jgi:hypothetical protein
MIGKIEVLNPKSDRLLVGQLTILEWPFNCQMTHYCYRSIFTSLRGVFFVQDRAPKEDIAAVPAVLRGSGVA